MCRLSMGLSQPRTRFPSDSGPLYQKSLNRVKGKKNRQPAIFLSVPSLSFRRKAESGGFNRDAQIPPFGGMTYYLLTTNTNHLHSRTILFAKL